MLGGKTRLIGYLGDPTFSFKAPFIYNPWFEARGGEAGAPDRRGQHLLRHHLADVAGEHVQGIVFLRRRMNPLTVAGDMRRTVSTTRLTGGSKPSVAVPVTDEVAAVGKACAASPVVREAAE